MEVIGGTPVFTPGHAGVHGDGGPLIGAAVFHPQPPDRGAAEGGLGETQRARRHRLDSRPATALAKDVEAKTRVPDKYSGLKITGAETRIIRTDEGEPQQFLFITTNLDIDSAEIASRIGMWWHQNGWHDDDGQLDLRRTRRPAPPRSR